MNSISLHDRVLTPSKVVCIGRNYTAHSRELGNATPDAMVLFTKPNSAIASELHYDKMIHKPHAMLAEVASFVSLVDGDVLMTGTPEGVGPYKRGYVFDATLHAGDQPLMNITWLAR